MSPAEQLTIYVFVLKVHLSQLPNLIPAQGSILIGNVLKLAVMKSGRFCAVLEFKILLIGLMALRFGAASTVLSTLFLAQRHIGPASCIWR